MLVEIVAFASLMQTGKNRLAVVKTLLVCQLVCCVIMSVVALAFDRQTAYSILLGGLICVIPNSYFAYRAFQFQGARAARQIVRSFYRGEAGKLLLTALLFAAVFKWVAPLNALALFGGYCGVLFVGWVVPLWHESRTSRSMAS